MRLKTLEQLKGAIRNIAKEKQLKPQEVLQMFLFERILERLSLSRYKYPLGVRHHLTYAQNDTTEWDGKHQHRMRPVTGVYGAVECHLS